MNNENDRWMDDGHDAHQVGYTATPSRHSLIIARTAVVREDGTSHEVKNKTSHRRFLLMPMSDVTKYTQPLRPTGFDGLKLCMESLPVR